MAYLEPYDTSRYPTRRVPRHRDNFVFLLLPMVLLFELAGSLCSDTHDRARTVRKGILKRRARQQRHKVNQHADKHDVAISNSRPKATKHNVSHSHLLRLPAELRQQVYDLYLESGTINIQELSWEGAEYKLVGSKTLTRYYPDKNICMRTGLGPVIPEGCRLPLTCQQIYTATIEYLYTRNTFRFNSHDEALLLPRLMVFPRKYLDILRSLELHFCMDSLAQLLKFTNLSHGPKHNRSVHSLPLEVIHSTKQWKRWVAFWKFLATLSNLRSLHVELSRLATMVGHANTKEWMIEWSLAPLMRYERQNSLRQLKIAWRGVSKGW